MRLFYDGPAHRGRLFAVYIVKKSLPFSAAHALRDYEGPCARVHGHNYRVEVEVAGESLLSNELLVDFYDLDALLQPLVDRLDHQLINEIPPFTEINPTAEAMAAWFFRELKKTWPQDASYKLRGVHVWETDDSCASYIDQ